MLSGCVVVLLLSETLSEDCLSLKGSGSFLLSPKRSMLPLSSL